jgi:hypothetical protein
MSHPAWTPCTVCGVMPPLNAKGEVPNEWSKPYGHTAPCGSPCRGAPAVKIKESRWGRKRMHAA